MPLVGSEKVGGIGCRCSTSSLFWKLVIVFCQERPENRRNCRSHSFPKPHSNSHPAFIFSSWIEDRNRACWYNEEESVHKEWMTSHGTYSTVSLLSIISFALQVISSSWWTWLEALSCFLWCFSHHVFSSRYPRLTKWLRRSWTNSHRMCTTKETSPMLLPFQQRMTCPKSSLVQPLIGMNRFRIKANLRGALQTMRYIETSKIMEQKASKSINTLWSCSNIV